MEIPPDNKILLLNTMFLYDSLMTGIQFVAISSGRLFQLSTESIESENKNFYL